METKLIDGYFLAIYNEIRNTLAIYKNGSRIFKESIQPDESDEDLWQTFKVDGTCYDVNLHNSGGQHELQIYPVVDELIDCSRYQSVQTLVILKSHV